MERKPSSAFAMSANAIISPQVDFWCIGGLSVVLMLGVIGYILTRMATGGYTEGQLPLVDLFVFQALLNWPHFVVSYKLLYGEKGNFKRYPGASLYVPAVLLAVCVFSLVIAKQSSVSPFVVNQTVASYFWLVATLYLAWHYTGQAWGMVAVFARLSDLKFRNWEHLALRNGLKSMIVWHVVWGLQGLPPNPYISLLQTPLAMQAVNAMAVCAFAAGAYALATAYKRAGRIDPRIIAPWLALFLWYVVLYLEPGAFMLVQLSHALQYMIFPARMEINKTPKAYKLDNRNRRALTKVALLYALSIVGGLLIFYVPDWAIGDVHGLITIGGMLAFAVNIHHYYTDSAIWKIQRKDVGQALFAHCKGV